MKTTANEASYGSSIYILAQSGTNAESITPRYVSGMGSEMKDNLSLKNRSKKKIIGQSMALSLVNVAMKKNQPQRVQSYWNTYHCQTNVTSSGDRIYGKYCKNRFCPICLGIRKAKLMNKYLPIIDTWEEPYFVTLTVKSYGKRSLKKMIDGCLHAFKQIQDAAKKRHQRGKGIKLIGIRSLECNFNPVRRTYNPHFHIIVPNKETADLLVSEWLKKWGSKYTVKWAQKASKIADNGLALTEIIKYGSKIFTEPDLNKKSKQKVPAHIYASALDNILAAMKGHRIFDRFGFNLPPKEIPKGGTITKLKQYDEWAFKATYTDWVSVYSGELLTEYKMPFELHQLLEHNIDVQLE